MKKVILSILFVLIVIVFVVIGHKIDIYSSTPDPTLTPIPTIQKTFSTDKLWSLIQNWRQSQGLKPYIKDQKLCKIADLRVDQIQNDYSHDLFIKKYSNYPYVLSENLSAGTSEQLVLDKWLNSPPHLANLKAPYTSSCLACENFLCVQIFSSFSTDKNNPY